MKLAFSTLGCSTWSWEQMIDEAARLGYEGVELRGVGGELRLSRCEAFQPDRLDASAAYAAERGISIVCIGTSCVFHDDDRFEASLDEGRESIDQAVRIGAPFIRVFGDKIVDADAAEKTAAQVARGLQLLGEYAEGKGVTVLLETHGDFSSSDRLQEVLRQTTSPAIGLIWDILHTIHNGKQTPSETWHSLGRYIRHAHIKDAKTEEGSKRLTLVGEGDLPLQEWLDILRENGYDGWLSFEWEKRWHPHIEEPEVAFPAFISYIRQYGL